MVGDRVWRDEAAGPLIRPYTVTGGRTDAGPVQLDLITLVVTVPGGLPRRGGHADPGPGVERVHQPEHMRILTLSARATSIVELSAHLALPVAVVKTLVGDLLRQGLVTTTSSAPPDLRLLESVLEGIRRL